MLSRRKLFQAAAGAFLAAPAFISSRAPARGFYLGWKWNVVEVSVSANQRFVGTWTLRPGTSTFDAEWRMESTGQMLHDTIEFSGYSQGRVTLLRRSLNGRYIGRISPDGRSIEGDATWYKNGDHWTAEIV